jgi:D-alanyl-D-alanine carboxypeptidase
MHENGKIPASALADIPGGRLDKEAAANWIALRKKGAKELGILISPLGPRSSYRTFDEQVHFWNLFQSGRGNLAARPGTSNHGLGRAVDLAQPGPMRRVIDNYGKPFGWTWGEAPSEPWHVTYRGGGRADASALVEDEHPTLRDGDRGPKVKQVQRWLIERGFDITDDGVMGPKTIDAINRVYRAWGHEAPGRFTDVGWSILEGKHPWRVLENDERRMLGELFAVRRIAKRAGGFKKVDAAHRQKRDECRKFLVERRKELWRAGQKDNWKKERRKRRYLIIKRATVRHGAQDDD